MGVVSCPYPSNETERLAHLHATKLLDTANETAFDDLVKLAAVICEMPISTVTLVDSTRQWFKAQVGLTYCESSRTEAYCSWAIMEEEILVVEDTRQDPRFCHLPAVTGSPFLIFYAGAIVRSPSGHALGTVCVMDHEPCKLSRMQVGCLLALARQAGALIASRIDNQRLEQYARELHDAHGLLEARSAELEAVNVQLEELANTDGLTGLLNRRCLMQLAEELARNASQKRPLSVLLADVDHFKLYNDNFGHLAGDEVLREMGQLLRDATRTSDLIGRYGGEEFCILMPNTDGQTAIRVGERLRQVTKSTQWPRRPITLSMGIATVTAPEQFFAAFRAADEALYESKRAGRDRLHIAS